jgi:hypothetical protein
MLNLKQPALGSAMCEHISASITGLANDPQTFKAFVQQ